jgi:hypothetical protein
MNKLYEARIILQPGRAPITVTVTAQNPFEARRIIEAQYDLKRISTLPHEKY